MRVSDTHSHTKFTGMNIFFQFPKFNIGAGIDHSQSNDWATDCTTGIRFPAGARFFSLGAKRLGLKLTTHLFLVSRLMRGAVPPLSPSSAWRGA